MKDIELLKQILLSNNIKKYEEDIFKIIPELKLEKDFEQKSEWHSYDVWNHTIKAIEACDFNFEDRLVLLLHDIGKPSCYQDDGQIRHFRGHSYRSMVIAHPILERLGYKNKELENLLLLIFNHSKKINIDCINKNKVDFYKRLIKIQKCDSSAYEPHHAKLILEDLYDIENILNEKYSKEKRIIKKRKDV